MARKLRSPTSGRTILVVDDQEETLLSTRSLLEREGHDVITADSGECALALLKEREVDVMLVDYFMPRMTGEEFVRQVRVFDPFVQIILQTGYSGDKRARSTFTDLDIQGYHDKADGPEKLLLWIDAGLKAQRLLNRAREQESQLGDGAKISNAAVLVLDPRRKDLEALTGMLESGGCQPLPAQTVAEALDLFVRERPNHIVIDEALLDQSGAELIRRVRALDPSVAIIARCGSLVGDQRRQVRNSLALHGIHDKRGEPPARLLELLESASDAAQRHSKARADHALRGLILAKLCHELRSCIHVVHGYAEVLGGEPAPGPFETIVKRLLAASDTARELVQGYLDLARLESRGIIVRRELVSIDALIDDLRAQAERQIGDRPLRFVLTVPSPGAVVHTDGDKLRAILSQLVANAIKFSTAGTVELSVRFGTASTDFVIGDSGPGMSHVDLATIFEPFQEESEQQAGSTPGQGLGLAIALRLSQLLGASLTAEHGQNGGGVFTLNLPVAVFAEAQGAIAPTIH